MKIFEYISKNGIFSNTYIIEFHNSESLLIDPGDCSGELDDFIYKNKLYVKYVIITHAHFDHILNLESIIEKFNPIIYINDNDEKLLYDSYLNVSKMLGYPFYIQNKVNKLMIVKGDSELIIGDCIIKILHTPFHTMGSICILMNNKFLFSGDTLFKNGIGRYDLPTSCENDIQNSLNKLKELDSDIVVYPGHGPKTTIGREFKSS